MALHCVKAAEVIPEVKAGSDRAGCPNWRRLEEWLSKSATGGVPSVAHVASLRSPTPAEATAWAAVAPVVEAAAASAAAAVRAALRRSMAVDLLFAATVEAVGAWTAHAKAPATATRAAWACGAAQVA